MSVTAGPGRFGMPSLIIACAYGSTEIQLQGAHVTSWRPRGGDEMLFVSDATRFGPGHVIRGGIPIAFPQFAELGPLPMHGFVHLAEWSCAQQSDTGVRLALHDSEESRALWPYAFRLEFGVELAPAALELTFTVDNTGRDALPWAGTLHTFLALDAGHAALRGLGPANYVDRANGSRVSADPNDVLHIPGHTDRAYLDAGARVDVDDGHRHLVVTRDGFRDTVVWNPGPETSGRFIDLLPDDHRSFLCVEAAEVRTVTVPVGGRWSGGQKLAVFSTP